ncbi:MAG TPA: putative nucleotidyltransferase substrate binding domain-containing protein [Desulfuromonadaceae bacterium]
MPIVISSKGADVTAWREAEEFGLLFRQMLLDKSALLTSAQFETLLGETGRELERRAAEHDAALAAVRRLMDDASAAADPLRLGALIREFYGSCYALFGRNRSAPAFYRLSEAFLGAVARSALGCAVERLNLPADRLPPLALIALGPTGRHEFSPFCSPQLLLVHGGEGAAVDLPGTLGPALHEVFEEAGLHPDGTITPRNPDWCGTLAQWRHRLVTGLEEGESAELVDLLRLADQTVLFSADGLEGDFRDLCMALLHKSRPTLAFLVARVLGLSNGVGLMGGLRLERSGPHRGLFALFDHALLPLTASVTALSLITGGTSVGTPQRIRELLAGRKLDVELAERVLEAWHTLNEFRLAHEGNLFPDTGGRVSLYFDPDALPDADMERFREALETVGLIQRHVSLTFSEGEE